MDLEHLYNCIDFNGFSLLEAPCKLGFLKPNYKKDTLYIYFSHDSLRETAPAVHLAL